MKHVELKPKTRHDNKLPVEKIIREFEEEEAKPENRGNRFKIDVQLDEALKRIMEPKQQSSRQRKNSGNNPSRTS